MTPTIKRSIVVQITHHAARCLPWTIVDPLSGADHRFKTVEDAKHWAAGEGHTPEVSRTHCDCGAELHHGDCPACDPWPEDEFDDE